MTSSRFIPNVLRSGKDIQLSYELPHRIHTAKVYPIPSPNRSAVIVYGYENGIRILWRGGRPFKATAHKQAPKARVNGTSSDAVMLLDSDDEATPTKAQPAPPEEPEFLDEEEEFDELEPYLPIIQDLDLFLGLDVLDVTFPQIDPLASNLRSGSRPPVLSQKIIIGAVCSDETIRVISVPLTPPSPASKARQGLAVSRCGDGRWGESMLVLGGPSAHQETPSGIAMTFTAPALETSIEDDTDMEDVGTAQRQKEPEARERSRSTTPGEKDWDLLVASHSPEINGLLLVYRISIIDKLSGSGKKPDYTISTNFVPPFQTQHLSSPATCIAFNPSPYPARRHSQLLVAETSGAVRIFECLPPRSDTLSTTSAEILPDQAHWLASFYPGFAGAKHKFQNPLAPSYRKQVLDAQWTSGGSSITVLLGDGEWGVWDLEGVSPGAKKHLLQGQRSSPGIVGGATTTFNLRGWIDNVAVQSSSSSSGNTERRVASKGDKQSKLVPMTPGTRRTRQELLFSGPQSASSSTAFSRGGLSISPSVRSGKGRGLTGATTSEASSDDETIVMWHGKTVAMVPRLQSYWQRQHSQSVGAGKGNLFVSPDARLIKLDAADLQGEAITAIDQFHTPTPSTPPMRDILIAGEHRIVIFSTPLPEPSRTFFGIDRDEEPTALGGSFASHVPTTAAAMDQQLLSQGELDLNGMDRMLADMDGGEDADANSRPLFATRRRVDFLT
ncbi:hypothetical protein L228DRAFT_266995 [Xylona heveae TC161]|uniref:Nucleoporin NUP37 n=1 Tax=Xylona heveae (strain CBS 132557 / TC161) TaxID=1328760 RepID=A0A165IBV1_XYLHT|nr:hypothetical protein L228DRAFT_266995 [Xylona heveae TC161]KZF24682.1 hypothetical protein L228DRAFT_266995 [Xylona heveae TC161]